MRETKAASLATVGAPTPWVEAGLRPVWLRPVAVVAAVTAHATLAFCFLANLPPHSSPLELDRGDHRARGRRRRGSARHSRASGGGRRSRSEASALDRHENDRKTWANDRKTSSRARPRRARMSRPNPSRLPSRTRARRLRRLRSLRRRRRRPRLPSSRQPSLPRSRRRSPSQLLQSERAKSRRLFRRPRRWQSRRRRPRRVPSPSQRPRRKTRSRNRSPLHLWETARRRRPHPRPRQLFWRRPSPCRRPSPSCLPRTRSSGPSRRRPRRNENAAAAGCECAREGGGEVRQARGRAPIRGRGAAGTGPERSGAATRRQKGRGERQSRCRRHVARDLCRPVVGGDRQTQGLSVRGARRGDNGAAVSVVVVVGPSGRIVSHSIVRSSGNAQLDGEVDAMMAAVQAPPPPNGSFRGGLTIRFNLD